MKIIEHRRHSFRKTPGGIHLIQKGVDLARKTGNTMGAFAYVVTSPIERAFETAIAMGYAVDITLEELAEFDAGLDSEIKYETLTFSKIRELLGQDSHTLAFAKKQVDLLMDLSENIKDNESLFIISHGGILDIPLVYLFMDEDHSSWGPLFNCCEGYRIFLENNKVLKYELLRTT